RNSDTFEDPQARALSAQYFVMNAPRALEYPPGGQGRCRPRAGCRWAMRVSCSIEGGTGHGTLSVDRSRAMRAGSVGRPLAILRASDVTPTTAVAYCPIPTHLILCGAHDSATLMRCQRLRRQ